MTFSSIPFLFYFLPLFLAAYFASPWKNPTLLLGSLLFYAWGEPVYVALLVASLVFNHIVARAIAAGRRGALAAGVAVNLGALAVFKYAGLLASGAAPLFPESLRPVFDIEPHLPLGISFYTFQAISLLIDVSRRDAEPPRSFIDTALYITIFPQLIAGPIVRYKSIAEQIRSRDHTLEKFSAGAQLFILGLAQKTLLANSFAPVADAAFDAGPDAALTAAAAWTGLFAYALQIYFDFAGYSNMAVGMGRMFGFEFPRNFEFPYTAQSVSEFWRRWHITLSQWFRDYLYIPLGGNRGSPVRTYVNLWIVFLLCGLWHGAAVVFVLWGAWHGALLVLERAFLSDALKIAPAVFRRLYLLLAVSLGWVLFRSADPGAAGDYYAALLGLDAGAVATRFADVASEGFLPIAALGALIALWPLVRDPAVRILARTTPPSPALDRMTFLSGQAALAVLLIASAAALAGGSFNPFIYYRF